MKIISPFRHVCPRCSNVLYPPTGPNPFQMLLVKRVFACPKCGSELYWAENMPFKTSRACFLLAFVCIIFFVVVSQLYGVISAPSLVCFLISMTSLIMFAGSVFFLKVALVTNTSVRN